MQDGIRADDILEQDERLIPRAGGHAEDYLRAIAQRVGEHQVPVSMDIRQVPFGGWRSPKTNCLSLRPVDKRLKKFEHLNYAIPLGTGLRAGFYLLGGARAKGLGELGVLAGGATQMDMDNLQSLVALVTEYVIMPAMDHIARAAEVRQDTKGFFGT